MLSPIILFSHSVFATDLPTTVTVKPSLSISIPSSTVLLSLDPSLNDFGNQTLNVSVATNNPNGYKLYISTDDKDLDTHPDTDLVNTVNSSYSIPTLTNTITNATSTTFPTNTWGYRITSGTNTNTDITSTTDYFPYASNTMINYSNTATNGNNATLDFASRIDYTKPAGLYSLAFNLKTIPQVTQDYMQDLIDPSDTGLSRRVCNTESPTVVIDKRDEQAYLIQRLDDDKCWMLDNLNLDLTNQTIAEGLDETNTNATNTVLGYLRNGGGNSSDRWAIKGLSNSTYSYSNWVDSYSFSEPLVNRSGVCNSSINTNAPCIAPFQDQPYNMNTVGMVEAYRKGLGGYKIGTYYNYCAASAGSYCYGEAKSAGSAASGNSQYDICPSGWRMPTGWTIGEIGTLYTALVNRYTASVAADSTSLFSLQTKLSLPISGTYTMGSAWRQGVDGYYWTSTYDAKSTMVRLGIGTTSVGFGVDYRSDGNPIRCLLNEP